MVDKFSVTKTYTPTDAFSLLKECSQVKFDESVEVSVNLGIDVRKSDQLVRGATNLPHGLGRLVRVAVFAENEQAKGALEAGAEAAGLDDLIKSVKAGELPYDVVVATPDVMSKVASLGQILGPRGMMPNPKTGTVTADPATAVKNIKKGQSRYRADKGGVVHCSIGRISFEVNQLIENFEVLVAALKQAKPSSVKGTYIKNITASSTMGPGIKIDLAHIA